MKTCDICAAKLGLRKFAYKSGYVCNDCYKFASHNYTETIRQKSHEEIKLLCKYKSFDDKQASSFETSRKIGNYLLLDDKRGKICVLNNRLQNPDGKPEFFSIEDISTIDFYSNPPYDINQLQNFVTEKNENVINQLSVIIHFGSNRREITFLKNPVRTNSFAFKRIFSFAHETYYVLSDESNKTR